MAKTKPNPNPTPKPKPPIRVIVAGYEQGVKDPGSVKKRGLFEKAADAISSGKGVGSTIGGSNPYTAVPQLIGDAVAGLIDGVKKGIEGVGKIGQKLASNDGLGALTGVVDAAADAISVIPILGSTFASALKLASSSLNVFKGLIDSFAARGRELAPLNATIAQAVAETEVQKFFADLNEANTNAKEYADLIYAQAKMDREWQTAITELKKQLLPLATTGARLMTQLARELPAIMKSILVAMPGGNVLVAAVEHLIKVQEFLDLIEKNTKKDDKFDPMAALAQIIDIGQNPIHIPEVAPPKAAGANPPIIPFPKLNR